MTRAKGNGFSVLREMGLRPVREPDPQASAAATTSMDGGDDDVFWKTMTLGALQVVFDTALSASAS
ncbi:hypothetical protein SCHPADRAFT_902854 [Schizopora paradoxa]|uniref:Uncharacterized protein n=1 Tax=Schizopora paradoxa TaxID=27342 RepID=A0A0H2RZV3_9AGAM|nr:hypothetical protein SCHPADRAFT_902854 [Schizopora paradoxa]